MVSSGDVSIGGGEIMISDLRMGFWGVSWLVEAGFGALLEGCLSLAPTLYCHEYEKISHFCTKKSQDIILYKAPFYKKVSAHKSNRFFQDTIGTM